MSGLVDQIQEWSTYGAKVMLSLFGLLLGAIFFGQNNMLYFPAPPNIPKTPNDNPRKYRSPEEWQPFSKEKSRFEERFVNTCDGKSIHVWKMYQLDSNSAPTLIYFHGNAGNMGLRLPNAVDMYNKCGINVVMMDYRGYGMSTGSPTEEGLNLDAAAVLEHVCSDPRLANSPVVPFGRSLGGAVAIELTASFPDKIAGIVAENTFLSIGRMVDVVMPFISFWPLKALLLRINWDSERRIVGLTQPMLFIAGDKDELVPHDHMKTLHALADKSRGRSLFIVEGGHHNDTFMVAGSSYYVRLKAFMETLGTAAATVYDVNNDDEEPQQAIPTMQKDFSVRG